MSASVLARSFVRSARPALRQATAVQTRSASDDARPSLVDRQVLASQQRVDVEQVDWVDPPQRFTDDGAIIVDNVAFSLEWILSSPPPLHAFIESPTMVEWPRED